MDVKSRRRSFDSLWHCLDLQDFPHHSTVLHFLLHNFSSEQFVNVG